jgi:hypothetical protein
LIAQQAQKGTVPVILIDEDIDVSPSKKLMSHLKEDSSFLPENITPEKIEKKKVIKKVRFFDAQSNEDLADQLEN